MNCLNFMISLPNKLYSIYLLQFPQTNADISVKQHKPLLWEQSLQLRKREQTTLL